MSVAGRQRASIRKKLLALTLALTLVPVLSVLVLVATNQIREMGADMSHMTALMASMVVDDSAAALYYGGPAAGERALRGLARQEDFHDAALYDPNGRLFASVTQDESHGGTDGAPAQQLSLSETQPRTTVESDRIEVVRPVELESMVVGTLVLHTSATRLRARVNNYLSGLGLLIGGILFASLMLGLFVERMISRRLMRLADMAQKIAQKDDYSARAVDTHGDEISLVAEGFNRMLAEIARREKQAVQAMRLRDDFLSVASHELRTPLTSLKLRVQSMLELSPSFASAAQAQRMTGRLALTDRHIKRIERLMANLLDVSRIAGGFLQLQFEEVDLADTVCDVVAQLSAEITRSGVQLTTQLAGGVTGVWDPLGLEQVVVNLLANALKYGDGKPIAIAVTRDDQHARLVVRDGGPGIDPMNHARIFERFARAASMGNGGLGLGLYLTRQIVRAHGGTIAVESALGQGAAFTVELPRAREGAAWKGK
jgi:signal transduction histidine kinase